MYRTDPVTSLRTYDIPCTLGLEEVLEQELIALGAGSIKRRRGGATCTGDQTLGYRACLWLRSAVRVQEVLATWDVDAEDDLYDGARELPWEDWLTPDDTLAVDATVRDSVLTHSGYVALKTKDAICDRMREIHGRRPSVDRDTPTLPIKLRLLKGKVTLARDLAGVSLHKRGWRPIQVKSPLNEAVAAGLLLAAGYDGTGLLVDPMCGGATFLVEAAWIAQDRAPGLDRGFAFTAWPDVDKAVWHDLVGEALDRQKRDVDARFEGADHHAGAVALGRRGVHDADVQHLVRVAEADAATWKPSADPQWLFTNPPWGERLSEDVEQSWRGLAKALRNCPGVVAHVLCGNPELTKILGMRSDRRWPLKTGPVDAMLLRYQVRARGGTS